MRGLLYLIAIILVLGWLLGCNNYSGGHVIHILIVLAVIAILLKVIKS